MYSSPYRLGFNRNPSSSSPHHLRFDLTTAARAAGTSQFQPDGREGFIAYNAARETILVRLDADAYTCGHSPKGQLHQRERIRLNFSYPPKGAAGRP